MPDLWYEKEWKKKVCKPGKNMCEYVTIPQCFRPSYKNLKEKWWQMKKYYVHKKNWCLMPQPHLCIWTRQRKRMGPIYWSLIFFFLHSVEFFENLLIHIRKEICLHFNEMMCKKLNWIVIIGWKPMCSMLNWFNDFLKTYTGQLPTVFHIEKVISFLSQKILSCPF